MPTLWCSFRRRIRRKRGVAVETPQVKLEDSLATINVTYVDDGRVLDTPEELAQGFERAVTTEVALKGMDVEIMLNLFKSRDGSVELVSGDSTGETVSDEEMFACEVCDGLVKESDSECPHCGALRRRIRRRVNPKWPYKRTARRRTTWWTKSWTTGEDHLVQREDHLVVDHQEGRQVQRKDRRAVDHQEGHQVQGKDRQVADHQEDHQEEGRLDPRKVHQEVDQGGQSVDHQVVQNVDLHDEFYSVVFFHQKDYLNPADFNDFSKTAPISDGSLAHAIPAASNAANFSAAVPLPPDIMAPA